MVTRPTIMSLCTGYGGLDLAVKLVFPTAAPVVYCEREGYAAATLVARMESKNLVEAPIWPDVKTLWGRTWRGKVDCITAGYPCQPFSLAGRRQGVEDPRHLWPSIKRLVAEVHPGWCFFENVPNHLNLGFDEVARDLQEMGYATQAVLVSAEEIGAPHKRERLFILGHSKGGQKWLLSEWKQSHAAQCRDAELGNLRQAVADTNTARLQIGKGLKEDLRRERPTSKRGCREMADSAHDGREVFGERGKIQQPNAPWNNTDRRGGEAGWFPPGRNPDDPRWEHWPWPAYQPGFRRGSYGLAKWMDRLRLTGNGVVPLQGAYALCLMLADLEGCEK